MTRHLGKEFKESCGPLGAVTKKPWIAAILLVSLAVAAHAEIPAMALRTYPTITRMNTAIAPGLTMDQGTGTCRTIVRTVRGVGAARKRRRRGRSERGAM